MFFRRLAIARSIENRTSEHSKNAGKIVDMKNLKIINQMYVDINWNIISHRKFLF